jgi:hypothetical protein
MLKKILLVGSILITAMMTMGKVVGICSGDFFKQPMLRVDEKQIYIIDAQLRIGVIYSKEPFKKVAQFGGPGQGPGEFEFITGFMVGDRYIYVSNFPKLSLFSKKGQLIKEIRLKKFLSHVAPIGDNFIDYTNVIESRHDGLMTIKYTLYDSQLEKKKDFFSTTIPRFIDYDYRVKKKIVNWIRDCFAAYVYKDKIIVGTTEKGFYFTVFDAGGNKLYEIDRDEEKRKVTREEKKKKLEGIKRNKGPVKWKIYSSKYQIKFRDYYPAYKDFYVNDGRIYIWGFRRDYTYDYWILDLEGNFLKKGIIPMNIIPDVNFNFYSIENGKLYRPLEYNEEWVIDAFDIWGYEGIK